VQVQNLALTHKKRITVRKREQTTPSILSRKNSAYWLVIEIELEEDRRMGAGRTAVHVQHLSHPEYNCVKGA
jgi:hypothetical protein